MTFYTFYIYSTIQKQKNMKNFLIAAFVILTMMSCKKDEEIATSPEHYVFKQVGYLHQDAWSNQDSLYPVFSYQVAVMSNVHFDSVHVLMTVTLKDSSKIVLTESNGLENFGQHGLYAPNYQYPEYWVASLEGAKGVCTLMYGFNESDIFSFEYQGKVMIKGVWYTLPKEYRKYSDLIDSFWV